MFVLAEINGNQVQTKWRATPVSKKRQYAPSSHVSSSSFPPNQLELISGPSQSQIQTEAASRCSAIRPVFIDQVYAIACMVN